MEQEKPLAGRCSTWIDDEIDAMGLDVPDDMRPGCCVREEEDRKQAAKIVRVLKEADPVTKAVQSRVYGLRLNPSTVTDLGPQQNDDEDESSDFGSDGDVDDADAETRRALEQYRASRLKELGKHAELAKRRARRGHGDFTDVKEIDLPGVVKASTWVVAHFPCEGLEVSNELDEHLGALARRELRPRIVRVQPLSDGRSPALQAMGVAAPPAVVTFRRGRVAAVAAGYSQFGTASSSVEEGLLARWLAKAGAVGAGTDSSSEAEEGERGDEPVAGPFSNKGRRGALRFGGEPCAECGRTYPHEHVRALRAGGRGFTGRGGEAGSSDDGD